MFDWLDPDPAPPDFFLGKATVRDAALWQHARAFWGATFDPACEAAVVEPSTCLYGQVWYPHVAARLPVLIQQSSIDLAFTGTHAIDETQPAALAAWRHQAEGSLVDVSWLFSGDTCQFCGRINFLGDTSGGVVQSPAARRSAR